MTKWYSFKGSHGRLIGSFGKRGDENGEHRQAGEALHGGSAQSPGPGTGTAAARAINYYSSLLALQAQQAAGSIPAPAYQNQAYQNQLAGTQHMGFGAGFGGPSYLAQHMPAAQAYAMQKMVIQAQAVAVPQLKSEGLRVGEIIAHRVWFVHGGFLRSVFMDTVWAPSEIQSGKPELGHGVHAWKSQSEALRYGFEGLPPSYAPDDCRHIPNHFIGALRIYGRVALWGDIFEHENGYRAEFARIESLDGILPETEQGALGQLHKKYLL